MKNQNLTKLPILPVLLVVTLAMQAASLYTYTQIDQIIHKTLYQHGLTFNYKWATPYWNNSNTFQTTLTIGILLTIITTALIIFTTSKNNKKTLKIIVTTLPIIATILTIYSAYSIIQIDYIVHHDLYNYGLRFNSDWATPYYQNTNTLFTLIALASTVTLATPILTNINTQKQTQTKLIKFPPTKLAMYTLITTGTIAIIASIISNSSILAFIGLGLLFWGILFTFIKTEEYTKKALLDATAFPQQETLNQIIQELNYNGTPIYLSPKYFKNPETQKLFISKQNKTSLPTPEEIQKQETQTFTEQPKGILVNPPGSELTKLFEKTLNTNFTRTNLQYLQQNLPKLLIEDLEIARNIEIETKNNKIHVKIEHSTYKPNNINKQQTYPLHSTLSSAIACALTKTTGKPIIINKQQISQDNKTETIEYHMIEEEAPNKI